MKRKLNKQSRLVRSVPALSLAVVILALVLVSGVSADQPDYEPAYFNGNTVTINAIELSQHAPLQAQADLYLVVYPINWEELGVAAPQCNPCDHGEDGIGFDDFHDHVLDSIPSDPGHGEFRTLWHVFAVAPAYSFLTGGDPANDDAVAAAFASHLPAKSEAAVDALVEQTLPDGTPVAVEIDTNSYFLCSVVNRRAAK
jgi:hypothetical protein